MEEFTNSTFLLDSCIVEYWLDKDIEPGLRMQLSDWECGSLAVSEISYAELIDGAHKGKAKQVEELLQTYRQIPITRKELRAAGILSTIYKNNVQKTNGASFQDKIIAATAGVYDLPIITANVSDFPHPFFISVKSANIVYEKKSRQRLITIDILKINIDQIRSCYLQSK